MNAIVVEDGFLKILYHRCVRCYDCVKVCPYNGIHVDYSARIPIKCDLCDGEVLCVKVCPTGALKYED